MKLASNCFLTDHILQIWPPSTTGSILTLKNASGKEIWLQWRSDCRKWGRFWEQRRIILQKRHRKVREVLEWMYYAWRKLCLMIKVEFVEKTVFFLFILETYRVICYANHFVFTYRTKIMEGYLHSIFFTIFQKYTSII